MYIFVHTRYIQYKTHIGYKTHTSDIISCLFPRCRHNKHRHTYWSGLLRCSPTTHGLITPITAFTHAITPAAHVYAIPIITLEFMWGASYPRLNGFYGGKGAKTGIMHRKRTKAILLKTILDGFQYFKNEKRLFLWHSVRSVSCNAS